MNTYKLNTNERDSYVIRKIEIKVHRGPEFRASLLSSLKGREHECLSHRLSAGLSEIISVV